MMSTRRVRAVIGCSLAALGAVALANAAGWKGVQKPLGMAIAKLETADRLRVRYRAANNASLDVLVTLTRVGSSFELITVAANDPGRPQSSVTVADRVAYFEDVGLRFDRVRKRFRIKLHENCPPDVTFWHPVVRLHGDR